MVRRTGGWTNLVHIIFYIEKNVDLKQCDKKSGPLIAN